MFPRIDVKPAVAALRPRRVAFVVLGITAVAANPPILRREAIAGEETFCTLSVPRPSSGDGIAARRARHASSDRQAGAGGIVSWTLYAWNDRVRRLDLSALAGNFTDTTLI